MSSLHNYNEPNQIRENVMGSRGSGNFSDYPGSSPKGEAQGSSGGGAQPEDRCVRAFSATLEDVEHHSYFKANGAGPPVGTALTVAHQKRIVATTADGVVVGNLPTSMNYLAACLKDGFTYSGEVRASTSRGGVATVAADFAPSHP